ncbi:hypothetical protein HDU76_011317, partial [Blyttiomyces sp. JEL0837]
MAEARNAGSGEGSEETANDMMKGSVGLPESLNNIIRKKYPHITQERTGESKSELKIPNITYNRDDTTSTRKVVHVYADPQKEKPRPQDRQQRQQAGPVMIDAKINDKVTVWVASRFAPPRDPKHQVKKQFDNSSPSLPPLSMIMAAKECGAGTSSTSPTLSNTKANHLSVAALVFGNDDSDLTPLSSLSASPTSSTETFKDYISSKTLNVTKMFIERHRGSLSFAAFKSCNGFRSFAIPKRLHEEYLRVLERECGEDVLRGDR